MKCLILMAFLILVGLSLPMATFAQVDAGQDQRDAQPNDDDHDRCHGLYDPSCADKTPLWFRVAWPIGIVCLFFGLVYVVKIVKKSETVKK